VEVEAVSYMTRRVNRLHPKPIQGLVFIKDGFMKVDLEEHQLGLVIAVSCKTSY
jgi:hypothetical protein